MINVLMLIKININIQKEKNGDKFINQINNVYFQCQLVDSKIKQKWQEID